MRLIVGCEQVKLPALARSSFTTQPSIASSDGRPGISGHLDKAESVVGEAWFVDLGSLAFERVEVRDFRAAQVVQVQRAVVSQRLGVAQSAPSCPPGRRP